MLEACRHAQVAAPHLRLDLERLRRQHRHALHRGPGRRPPAAVLRRHQAGERADGACLRHLYRLPCTGLRFFTVYGPWGRPDMAPMLFASAILEGRPIKVFNHGRHSRDFTYIDDIVEGVIRASRPHRRRPIPTGTRPTPTRPPRTRPSASTTSATTPPSGSPTSSPRSRRALGRPGDPRAPAAAARRRARHLRRTRRRLARAVNWRPATPVARGGARFVAWYRDYREASNPARRWLAGPADPRQEGISRIATRPGEEPMASPSDNQPDAAGAARPRHAPQRHLGDRRPARAARRADGARTRSGPTAQHPRLLGTGAARQPAQPPARRGRQRLGRLGPARPDQLARRRGRR